MTSPWETYDALIEDLPEDVAVGADETATILEEIGRRAAPERH